MANVYKLRTMLGTGSVKNLTLSCNEVVEQEIWRSMKMWMNLDE